MRKARIAVPKTGVPRVVEALHKLGTVQIIDYKEDYPWFRTGTPLPGAEEASHQLVRVRGMIKVLDLRERTVTERLRDSEIDAWLKNSLPRVDQEVTALHRERSELEARIAEIEAELSTLAPLRTLPPHVRFDLEHAVTIAGLGKKALRFPGDIDTVVSKAKTKGGWAYAFLCERGTEVRMRKALSAAGFREISVPPFKGGLGEHLKALDSELPMQKERLEALRQRAAELREKEGKHILAVEEHLSNRLDRLQAPLLFAASERFTVIEGWTREKDIERLEDALHNIKEIPAHIEVSEPALGDEPPVVLSTSPRSFQFLQRLYSVPRAKETDPTMVLAITFCLFFGLMVGDLAYGLLLIALGALLRKKFIFGIGGKAVGNIIIMGGICSGLFGALLFGDALGIPFHAVHGEVSWSSILGWNVPLRASVHKLESHDVISMMVFSVFAGFVHMALGLLFGIANKARAGELKHALGKVAWLLIMVSLFLLLMKMAEQTVVGQWLTSNLMFNIQHDFIELAGVQIPRMTVPLLVSGILLLITSEGIIVILEIFSVLSFLVSYTRLAAIGMAKAATAFAFNTIAFGLLLSGDWLMIVMGGIIFIIAHAFVLILGALSSGIQALRLNYVEFFLKFFEGGGHEFAPFRGARRYTKE